MSIDMFIEPDNDPRTDPPPRADERTTLVGFLRWQRDTEVTVAAFCARQRV